MIKPSKQNLKQNTGILFLVVGLVAVIRSALLKRPRKKCTTLQPDHGPGLLGPHETPVTKAQTTRDDASS